MLRVFARSCAPSGAPAALRPRPDDQRRWYAAVLDDGGDDAPLALSVQVEVDGGATHTFAARAPRKEDVLRPQPEHELVASALPAFLARVAACCTIADVCAASDEHGAELEEAERAAITDGSLRNWTRRPLGAAAAASLLKAAGARDDACAYACTVRDAPPATPCALFRGSSDEAPPLESLVAAATRYKVLSRCSKGQEKAPRTRFSAVSGALIGGATAPPLRGSRKSSAWSEPVSASRTPHRRGTWC